MKKIERNVDRQYAQQFQFSSEINAIQNYMNNIIKTGALLEWYKDVLREKIDGISEEEIKELLVKAYDEEAVNRGLAWDREEGDWINNPQSFNIQITAPPEHGDKVTFPWIELRRFNKDDSTSSIVQVAIIPLPSEFEFRGEKIKIGKTLRHKIIDEMQKLLAGRSLLAGGVGTIDIGTNKKNALQELIRRLNLDYSYTVYFGDEFTSRGGDYPVTQLPGVTVFSASLEKGQAKNVFLVGEGPISIWNLLEQYIWLVNFD